MNTTVLVGKVICETVVLISKGEIDSKKLQVEKSEHILMGC